MALGTEEVFKGALCLPPKERAELIDRLISTLDETDEHIDDLWRRECENRIEAYQNGKIRSVSLEQVLLKYGYSFSGNSTD